jgi:fucose 4-O-acetylase-like acetyltransferase
MQPERNSSIDIAKGLGIILVLLVHTVALGTGYEILHKFISCITMPLFLGISGIYITSTKRLAPFVKSRLLRFIVPFLFWVAVYFIFNMATHITKIALHHFMKINEVEATSFFDLQNIKNIFIVPIMANWASLKNADVFVELWFLPAVFSIVILYRYLYQRIRPQKTVFFLLATILLSFIIVYLNNLHRFHDSIPWSIDIAIVCLPFLIICRNHSYADRLHWIAIPFLLFAIYYFSKGMQVEVAGLMIEDYPRFFIAATSGIILAFLVSARLQSARIGKILSEIGKRTYLIFLLQGIVYAVFRPVMARLPLLGKSETIFNFVLFFAALICGYLLFPLFDKYNYLRLFALGQGHIRRVVTSDK